MAGGGPRGRRPAARFSALRSMVWAPPAGATGGIIPARISRPREIVPVFRRVPKHYVKPTGGGGTGGPTQTCINYTYATWTNPPACENLVEDGVSAAITYAYVSGDGNPAGCGKFSAVAVLATTYEWARVFPTNCTWIDLGVPAGATVVSVQLVSFDDKAGNQIHSFDYDGTQGVRFAFTDPANNTAIDRTYLLDTLPNGGGLGWIAGLGTPGQVCSVLPAYQAASSQVRLGVQYYANIVAGEADNIDWRFDNVKLKICYYTTKGRIERHVWTGGRPKELGRYLQTLRTRGAISTPRAVPTRSRQWSGDRRPQMPLKALVGRVRAVTVVVTASPYSWTFELVDDSVLMELLDDALTCELVGDTLLIELLDDDGKG